jgi:predicted RNA-binding protein YlxR (DUF448 family)
MDQSSMVRLKHRDDLIVKYDGYGRSFYICPKCSQDMKKIKFLSKRFKQDEEYLKSIVIK